MIVQCKAHIMEGGKLWDQDQPKLVGKLRAALKLGEAYQKQYRAAWEGPGSHAVCLYSFDLLSIDLPFLLFSHDAGHNESSAACSTW